MIAVITSIELKNPFKFFALSYNALQILTQLKRDAKYLDGNTKGFWTKHYTMTLWANEKDMIEFSKNGAHLEAMRKSAKLAKEIRTLAYETESLPNWNEARQKLITEGKILRF